MNILTTTMCYPTAAHPDQGIFVQRRCLALAQLPDISLRVASPQPWCPLLRQHISEAFPGPLPASYPRMFSIPVLGWATDGLAFSRAIESEILSQIIAGRRPDVIDAHFEYPDAVGAWLAGRRFGIPVVATIRGKIVSLSRKALRRRQMAWMLRGVAARICVSRSLAQWVRRIGGSDLNVNIIPNGIDRAVFHPTSPLQARQSLRWEPQARYVLAVGHQQFVKGFDRVLATVAAVREPVPETRFVLVGSTRGERPFREQLERQVADINRAASPESPAIQLLPCVPSHTLNLMYNAADVLVNASRSEGWCNAISESLACGTPVVATDVGGNSEQVSSREWGSLVADGDTHALSAAIIDSLSRNWDRQAIAAAGSVRTWSETARQAYDVLAEAVRHHPTTSTSQIAGALP